MREPRKDRTMRRETMKTKMVEVLSRDESFNAIYLRVIGISLPDRY
jgi:hypothetical protein